jgi:hypothetical protein
MFYVWYGIALVLGGSVRLDVEIHCGGAGVRTTSTGHVRAAANTRTVD